MIKKALSVFPFFPFLILAPPRLDQIREITEKTKSFDFTVPVVVLLWLSTTAVWLVSNCWLFLEYVSTSFGKHNQQHHQYKVP